MDTSETARKCSVSYYLIVLNIKYYYLIVLSMFLRQHLEYLLTFTFTSKINILELFFIIVIKPCLLKGSGMGSLDYGRTCETD